MQHFKNLFIVSLAFAYGLFVSCNQSGTTSTEPATTVDSTAQTPPPAAANTIAMVISHHVTDYATWRPFFDKDEANRQAAQMKVLGVFQDVADPNYVSVSVSVTNVEAAKQFAASEELKKVMAEAGVTDQPEVKFYELAFMDENAANSSDNRLFLICKVSDYNAFRQVFDEREQIRKDKGISTVVVARNVDDAAEVAIALTAADMEVLKKHMAGQDVKDAMQKAGVIGEAIIQYAKKAAGSPM